MNNKDTSIAIIGLGYVGLPLAIEFGKLFKTIGFDVNKKRIDDLKNRTDHTLEVATQEFEKSINLSFSVDRSDISLCNVFIITVPTPIDKHNRPDLTPLLLASETVGNVLKKGDVVIYESTVYPGCTEEDCVPVLEKYSGLRYNIDFFCGYSPERINPGDKNRRLIDIKKITSGSTPEIAKKVDELYNTIIKAGTYSASSLKIAEAAKVIENAQRDINIAFVNELSMIFHKLGIDTNEVLEAASTKWNFLPFKPGLVGGHCIGVDPYYLTHKAQELGYHPEIILAGRRLNDSMGAYVANRVLKQMIKKGIGIAGSNVLIMGITFKENCPDIRNTRALDIREELIELGCNVQIYDCVADHTEVKQEYGIDLLQNPNCDFDAIIMAVAHNEFKTMNLDSFARQNHVIFDVKGFLSQDVCDERL